MRVSIRIVVTFVAILLPSAVFGQVTALWGGSEDKSVPASEQTVQVVLHPASAPRPALKYQLLPSIIDRRPGNAAVWWNRIPADQDAFFRAFEAAKGPCDRISKWVQIPLTDLRSREYREKELVTDLRYLRTKNIFDDMDRAARFESCDWELPIHEGGFIGMLIPDAQQLRRYARLLQARAHMDIADGQYDDAVHTLQTGYALARHAAQGPTLIHGLVGVTIAGMMSGEVRQFVQRPDAPNLYWALSKLPCPLIDCRLGGEAESDMLYLQFPELRDIDKKSLSAEQWRELWSKLVSVSALWSSGKDRGAMMTTLATLQSYPPAKRYLIENGRSATEVEAMPVAQVLLLHTVHVYNEAGDEQFKWCFLSYAESREGWNKTERQWEEIISAPGSPSLLANMLPACRAVKVAETHCQWTIAMLRIFEAMRLYTATHDGQLPNQLSDITDVPIPVNPFDGKPFVYQRQGEKALLTSEHASPAEPWRQEISFARNEK